MTPTALTGQCFCGAVRYRCGTALDSPTVCHCESCRRISGAHAVAWLTVRAETLVYLNAKPVEFRSSSKVVRSYCGECGTPLSYRHDERADEIDITVATLNSAEAIVPIDHTWMQDALPWDRPGDALPRYSKFREYKG